MMLSPDRRRGAHLVGEWYDRYRSGVLPAEDSLVLNVTYPSGLVVRWERDERTGNLRVVDFDASSQTFLPNPDKRQLGEAIGLGSFDTAVPQPWLDRVRDLTGEYSLGFVWCYDPIVDGDRELPNIFGFPFPVTPEAEAIYAILPEDMR